jgi:hypothetical protein
MGELPGNKPSVRPSFLVKNRATEMRRQLMKNKNIRSDCCGASVIIVGQKAFQCIQCGSRCAVAVDYESMSYISKNFS